MLEDQPRHNHHRPLQHDLDAALLAFGLGRATAHDRAQLALGEYIAMEAIGFDRKRECDRLDWGTTAEGTYRMAALAQKLRAHDEALATQALVHVRNRCDSLGLRFSEVVG